MRITIAERLKPYQHLTGTEVLLPGTFLRASIFPALIRLHNLTQAEPHLIAEIPLKIQGPVKDFTVQQDLEKKEVLVWGFSQESYFRYRIIFDQGVHILFDKGGENIKINVLTNLFPIKETSRLSLGNHKAQDWCLVKRRLDLKEILPAWLCLGELLEIHEGSRRGTAELLTRCQEVIDEKKRTEVVPRFTELFTAGFEGILSPRLSDTQHQGFHLAAADPQDSPLILLSKGAQLISSLFVQPRRNSLAILPVLPPEFHCGRLLHYHWKGVGFVDLEWSKKLIKKLIFTSEVSDFVLFQFQKEVQRFRLNGSYFPVNQELKFISGQKYFFDCFEK